MVPEPRSARHIPWETGPLDQLGDQYGEQTGAPADQTIADGSLNGAAHGAEPGWSGSGWSETAAPAEPVRPDAAAPQGFAGHQVDDVPERPAPEPSMFDRPAQMPAAPPPAPPAPPQAQAGPPRMPERSPIFDAMQSEWFQRRSGETVNEDPVKGWESPADAGFRAAEAAREPVAEKRTSVGLPKRVPGKNRVPGAVGKPGGTAQPPTVPAADPAAGSPAAAAAGRTRPGRPGTGHARTGRAGAGPAGRAAGTRPVGRRPAKPLREPAARRQSGPHRNSRRHVR
ncbi:hypothetical protein [Actinomadura sp. CNU-125]|uniref:hypothetical protein n=1 Tax=Actinomadura sp. CNU-125 TaxID=1904961 RepID=UPI001177559D|nr:hypothetical protein [Actinomadura sp. CNU-125]